MPDIVPTSVALQGMGKRARRQYMSQCDKAGAVQKSCCMAPERRCEAFLIRMDGVQTERNALRAVFELLLHLTRPKHAKVATVLEGSAVTALLCVLGEDFLGHALGLRGQGSRKQSGGS